MSDIPKSECKGCDARDLLIAKFALRVEVEIQVLGLC